MTQLPDSSTHRETDHHHHTVFLGHHHHHHNHHHHINNKHTHDNNNKGLLSNLNINNNIIIDEKDDYDKMTRSFFPNVHDEKNFSLEDLNSFVQKNDPDVARIKLNAKKGFSDTNFQRSTHHYCGTSNKDFTNNNNSNSNYSRRHEWPGHMNNEELITPIDTVTSGQTTTQHSFTANQSPNQFLDQFMTLCSRTRNTFVPPNLYPFRTKNDGDF